MARAGPAMRALLAVAACPAAAAAPAWNCTSAAGGCNACSACCHDYIAPERCADCVAESCASPDATVGQCLRRCIAEPASCDYSWGVCDVAFPDDGGVRVPQRALPPLKGTDPVPCKGEPGCPARVLPLACEIYPNITIDCPATMTGTQVRPPLGVFSGFIRTTQQDGVATLESTRVHADCRAQVTVRSSGALACGFAVAAKEVRAVHDGCDDDAGTLTLTATAGAGGQLAVNCTHDIHLSLTLNGDDNKFPDDAFFYVYGPRDISKIVGDAICAKLTPAAGCPGGSLDACIALCPTSPPAVHTACTKRCDAVCPPVAAA